MISGRQSTRRAIARRMVCEAAVTCALAVSRLAFGCRKILTIAFR